MRRRRRRSCVPCLGTHPGPRQPSRRVGRRRTQARGSGLAANGPVALSVAAASSRPEPRQARREEAQEPSSGQCHGWCAVTLEPCYRACCGVHACAAGEALRRVRRAGHEVEGVWRAAHVLPAEQQLQPVVAECNRPHRRSRDEAHLVGVRVKVRIRVRVGAGVRVRAKVRIRIGVRVREGLSATKRTTQLEGS